AIELIAFARTVVRSGGQDGPHLVGVEDDHHHPQIHQPTSDCTRQGGFACRRQAGQPQRPPLSTCHRQHLLVQRDQRSYAPKYRLAWAGSNICAFRTFSMKRNSASRTASAMVYQIGLATTSARQAKKGATTLSSSVSP